MRERIKAWILAAVMLCGVAVPVAAVATPVYAADKIPETNIIFKGNNTKKKKGIENLLKLIVQILVYGLGAAATIGVVIAGIMYLTARDNPQQVAKAKTRLIEVAIGLVAWAMLFSVLKFLIPGFSGI